MDIKYIVKYIDNGDFVQTFVRWEELTSFIQDLEYTNRLLVSVNLLAKDSREV